MRLLSVIVIFASLVVGSCAADSTFVDSLASAGKLGIPVQQARGLESRLGQLFIVNVDGFGYGGPLALEPEFAPMVERLQIGGVIPHYGSTNYERIRRTNRALKGLTRLPLLVCCDIVKIKGAGAVGTFGDGYVGGFLGRFKRLPDSELETLARLNAFVFAALGINVALGPTVDTSTRDPRTLDRARLVIAALKDFGLEPVLKHFPYLPARANLHKQSPDTRLPPDEAETRFAVFQKLADESGIMMTTHLYDSLVDTRIVTFSSAWNLLLRSRTGFGGLLMSDGLLMLRNYTDTSMLAAGPGDPDAAGIDRTASWALRAILAGHDFITVEGSAALTYRTFQGLLAVGCSNTPLGNELRVRIEESYKRIESWKQASEASLRREVDVPAAVIRTVVRALPVDGHSLSDFTFDARALASLQPALRAAQARP
ncbi:MAG: glycoside hydrolase family 3 N-terminal domain-containing protein [Spirochaetia bacterium]